MYSRDKKVKIPKSGKKGTIHVIKSGYVYLSVSYKWDSKNRKPIEKRVTIGVRTEDDETMMYPGPNYYTYFGTADEKKTEELKDKISSERRKQAGKIDSRISVGCYYALREACKKTGCYEALKQTYSSSDTDLILALAIHAIVAQNSCAQDFSSWCFDNYCGLKRVVSDSEVSRLYKELGEDEGLMKVFFKCYSENYNKSMPSSSHERVVAFDSTNQNVYSRNQELASFGKAKINLDLPIINTALFVDEETGIPMWYEHYDGSLLDKTQTPYSLKSIIDLGYKKLFAIFDRGYYSESMIKEMRAINDFDFGVLCPQNVKWVDALIDEHGREIKDHQSHYIADENVYAARFDIDSFGTKSYAYLFYDGPRANDEHTAIHESLRYYWQKALQRKRYSEKMAKQFNAYNIIVNKTEQTDEQGRNFELLEDVNGIQELLDRAGFFVMVSDRDLTPAEAIKLVRRRDRVEKCFESIKRHFDLSVTCTHSMKTYYGKMFMAFIASIIYATITNDFKDLYSSCSSRTFPALMAELNKYKADLSSEGIWMPVYALNRLQKEIFKTENLTEQDLCREIATLKLQL